MIQKVKQYMEEITPLPKPAYKERVKDLAEELCKIKREDLPPQEVINRVVECITEEYINHMEEYPDNYTLYRLSDFILLDYIKSVHKKKSDENAFHTEKQTIRRANREFLIDTNDSLFDFLHSKYDLGMDSLQKVSTAEVS